MTNKPAIVIAAYNRPDSLERLLKSVCAAHYTNGDINLVISIDKSDTTAVTQLSENFEWPHGKKNIIAHPTHLGLKQHLLFCGDLTTQYDSIIVLEDDLLVSPWYYHFVQTAAEFYNNDSKIAGISLYNYHISENGLFPFKAVNDGSDVYFMQVASSWGQLWTKTHWDNFKMWFTKNPELTLDADLPGYLHQWGKNSWKKHFTHYLISNDKYFVFPHNSLSTNFEEPGTNSSTQGVFNSELQLSKMDYRLRSIRDSDSVYDAWFEPTKSTVQKLNPQLNEYNFDVDLYATKSNENLKQEYLLTSKKGESPLYTYSNELFPALNNIALNLKGTKIGLYKNLGAKFKEPNPALKNVLETNTELNNIWMSVIIPVSLNELPELKASLNSIAAQAYRWKYCTVVANKDCYEELVKLKENYLFRIHVLYPSKQSNDFEKIQLALKESHGEFLSWIKPGTTFTAGSFDKAAAIFKDYPLINWIKGINHNIEKPESFYQTNTMRLTLSEAYKLFLKNQLNISMEAHFIRRVAVLDLINESSATALLFFKMLQKHGQTLVLWNFAVNGKFQIQNLISSEQRNHLINTYKPFEIKYNLFNKFLKAWFNSGILQISISQWYFPSKENYPDVLRFNEQTNSFYTSKS